MVDSIEFINRDTEELLKVQVVELLVFPDFETLFDNCNITDCGAETRDELFGSLSKFYSKDNIEKFGVLGIRVELI